MDGYPSRNAGRRGWAERVARTTGNILWDGIPLFDPALIDMVKALGGISTIAISHPHYYSLPAPRPATAPGCSPDDSGRSPRTRSRALPIGDAASAAGIEKDLVVAAQFDVLQTSSVTERVVGEVKNVIGLVKGQMDLEQVKALVDGVDESNLSGEGVQDADAAVNETAVAVGEVIPDVARGEHGFAAIAELGFVESPLDAALAVGEFVGFGRFHLKSSVARDVGSDHYSSNTAETPKDFEFFRKSPCRPPQASLG